MSNLTLILNQIFLIALSLVCGYLIGRQRAEVLTQEQRKRIVQKVQRTKPDGVVIKPKSAEEIRQEKERGFYDKL